jgi:hypothetical protein
VDPGVESKAAAASAAVSRYAMAVRPCSHLQISNPCEGPCPPSKQVKMHYPRLACLKGICRKSRFAVKSSLRSGRGLRREAGRVRPAAAHRREMARAGVQWAVATAAAVEVIKTIAVRHRQSTECFLRKDIILDDSDESGLDIRAAGPSVP